MRILHVWDVAGVASILAKYQRSILRWDSTVMTRKTGDVFGISSFYNSKVLDCGSGRFFVLALRESLDCDLVHLHSVDSFVPFFVHKPKILHYHGDDIRGKWDKKRGLWSCADQVIVSTKDLLLGSPSRAIYLPNPVDTELFAPDPETRREGTALHIVSWYGRGQTNLTWARSVAEKMGLNLTVMERGLSYSEMPRILQQFEFYIDLFSPQETSKTALEALSCGLKVVRWDETVLEELPSQHRPEVVVDRLADIYHKARE